MDGRREFHERMQVVRRVVILTIEKGWEIGLGPGGLGCAVPLEQEVPLTFS
jgi:hypothetical protein